MKKRFFELFIKKLIMKYENYIMRNHVAQNPNTSPETLKQMSIVEEDYRVKYYIKTNPNCSKETYKYFSALELLEELSLIYNM